MSIHTSSDSHVLDSLVSAPTTTTHGAPDRRQVAVVRCDESVRDLWNEFVAAHASFYHRYEWIDINREQFGHDTCALAAIESDAIVGVFPIVRIQSRLFGNIACSLPFVNFGGPVALSESAETSLLSEAERLVDEWKVDYLEIRSQRHLGERFPAAEHKVSMTVDLDRDPDVLWKQFKTGHRQDIRRAYKNGLSARLGGVELFEDFYAVLSESWRDLGTPIYSKRFLHRAATSFGSAIRLCVVYSGSEPAAASLDAVHGEFTEGLWLGARAKFRTQMAGYVLYWELIKDACERGLRRFHLGRSTAESGGEVFKKKWNAERSQLYWHYILREGRAIPQLNVSNPRYQLAINAWRRLPIPLTQVVGPYIARSIP